MVALPIIRHSTETDGGIIRHQDEPISWADADEKAGERLDRRKLWAFVNGDLCECISYTSACSGCSEELAVRGSGCPECGYHGRCRHSMWLPVKYSRAGHPPMTDLIKAADALVTPYWTPNAQRIGSGRCVFLCECAFSC